MAISLQTQVIYKVRTVDCTVHISLGKCAIPCKDRSHQATSLIDKNHNRLIAISLTDHKIV